MRLHSGARPGASDWLADERAAVRRVPTERIVLRTAVERRRTAKPTRGTGPVLVVRAARGAVAA